MSAYCVDSRSTCKASKTNDQVLILRYGYENHFGPMTPYRNHGVVPKPDVSKASNDVLSIG